MKRAIIGGVVLAVGLASSAWGYGYLESGLGSGVFQGSARGAGMGEVGLVSDSSPVALALNPALLANPELKHFALAYRFASTDETWAFPVHDSFDAVLGYNTYAASSKIYSDFTGGLATGGMAWAGGACLGVALVPAYDFRYDFGEEIRDRNSSSKPADLLIANNFIGASGEIRSLSAGLGVPVVGCAETGVGLGLGVGLDYLFGERKMESGVTFVDETKVPWEGDNPESSQTFSATGLAGARFAAGVNLALGRRVSVGASLKTECDLDGDLKQTSTVPPVETQSDITLKCPASYSLGVSFKPRNELPTVIEGNVVLLKWSEVEDAARPGVGLDDVYEWHVGVEHIFYNSRPLRFGFVFRPSPVDKETSESAVTAGTGLRAAGLDIDIAAKVGWREYRSADLFSDDIFGAETRGGTDLVKETVVGGSVSVSKRF